MASTPLCRTTLERSPELMVARYPALAKFLAQGALLLATPAELKQKKRGAMPGDTHYPTTRRMRHQPLREAAPW
eukprot:2399024-Alexandrium_andersonii.AAC.1